MIDTLRSAVDAAAELYEPDDTIGLLGLVVANGGSIIAAIGTIVVGVITVRGQRKGRDRWSSDRETLREIHEETVNSHRGKSNMREDLDKVLDGITALQHGQELQAAAITALQQGQEAQAAAVSELRRGQDAQTVATRDLQRDVGGIREEIRTERRERIAGDERNCTACR
ncbi:hypothetical protein SEA_PURGAMENSTRIS_27 [Mycobacterium phage Purgamenstris]|uniref:Membrane protein n=6 Tax=Charlievirus redi TaxID=2003505 RepID=A0A1I9SC81_9CAUD|nr:DUF2746 domain-containing protein [Mycobacterium phage Redi]AOZ64458.1 membrane protein [Mycobacterium phage PhancyPhin]QAY16009.1 hypothetical protein SEA_BABERUTH_27 [Mycobacterium phage BabeRuth]QBI99156.1 hypothetical protein SEA_NENAE_27 [Mycobacterium phage Nenae]QBI99227.1 hypothetical protein SEA_PURGAMENSTRIS_27 [Mycobacterium phage Purgamenstris]QBI99905.1 hypothetical protein SEA_SHRIMPFRIEDEGG_27 [Mycobacterium phage ShrimpFriedEgg]